MSGLDEGTNARQEDRTATTAVTDGMPPDDAAPWPAIDGDLLATDAPDDRRIAVPAFPLELLPQPWCDWTGDAARLAAAPVDYVAQAVLASVAAVGGRRVVVAPTPGWQESLRLWLAAVGVPGSGKSPALEAVRRVWWLLEDASPGTSPGTGTGAGGASPRRVVLGEAPFARLTERLRQDPRGNVLWRDEVVSCLAPPAGARSVRQLEPYGISIVGAVAPAGVERALRQDPDGVARFLYAWPLSASFRPLPEQGSPSDALVPPLRRLLQAFGALGEPHGLVLDTAAARVFEAFHARLHEERRQADGLEAAWLSKGGGAVACLAGVFTLMSWAASDARELPTRVDVAAVERAVLLWWDYYRPHARALFGQDGESEESRVLRTVRWLRTSGLDIISREQVRRSALSRSVDAREANEVIDRLVDGGALRPRRRAPAAQAGRPALRWDVNPLLSRATSDASLGARQSSAAHGMSKQSHDAPLEWRAPSKDASANGANGELH